MPVFEIEMLWDCRFCPQKRNRGLHRHCPNCGHPKDDLDREYMPDMVSVEDALSGEDAALADAGPDWKCKHCGSLQNPLHKCCTECGVPQGQGAKAWDAKEIVATFDPTSGVKTSSEQAAVHIDAPSTAPPDLAAADEAVDPADGADAATPTPTLLAVHAHAQSQSPHGRSTHRAASVRSTVRVMMVAACVPLTCLFLWLLFRTKVHEVRVSSVAWEHKVLIDRYQVWHRDGWDPDTDAFDIHFEPRIHHYDHVKVGSHQESYASTCGQKCKTVHGTCSKTPIRCRSNKNGTAKCSGGDRVCSPDTQDCTDIPCTKYRTVNDYEDQPRYRSYYDWSVWDWGFNRAVVHAGATATEDWPSDDELIPVRLADGERERESGRKATHKVSFVDPAGETWDIAPESCREFESYPIGATRKIKTGVAHGVEVLPERSVSY